MKKKYAVYFILTCFFIVNMLCFTSRILYDVYGTDIYFMIKSGEYIIKNHALPTTTFMNIVEYPTMIHQWLATLYFYGFYHVFGWAGIKASAILPYLILLLSFDVLLKEYHVNRKLRWSLVLIFCVANSYYLCARPQTLTYAVNIIELILLKRYYEKESVSAKDDVFLIAMLSFISIFIANWEASHIVMNFAFVLTYLVVPVNKLKDHMFLHKWLIFLISVPAILISSLLNPLGINALLFYFKASDAIKLATIYTMEVAPIFKPISPFFGNSAILFFWKRRLFFLFCVLIFAILLHKKKLQSLHDTFLFLGCAILAFMAERNIIYLTISFVIITAPIIKDVDVPYIKEYVLSKPIQVLLCATGTFLTIFVCVNFDSHDHLLYTDMEPAITYLNQNAKQGTKVYALYDENSILEFYGYRTYIDCRPEVYYSDLNGQEKGYTTLEEFIYMIGAQSYAGTKFIPGDSCVTIMDYYDTFINKYQFEYFIVRRDSEMNYYLSNNNYNYILDCGTDEDSYVLYKK